MVNYKIKKGVSKIAKELGFNQLSKEAVRRNATKQDIQKILNILSRSVSGSNVSKDKKITFRNNISLLKRLI